MINHSAFGTENCRQVLALYTSMAGPVCAGHNKKMKIELSANAPQEADNFQMKRVLEPELMDDPRQAAAYAGPALDSAYWLFMQLFRKYFPRLNPQATILDLGCGPAALPLLLAALYHNRRIHCVDGAAAMLELGRSAAQKQGLANRVLFFQGTLPDRLNLPQERYPVIISNSFLHHLADPMVLWNAIHRYSLPRAAILVVDLLRPVSEDQARRLTDIYLPGAPPLLCDDMLRSLRASFTMEEVRAQLLAAELGENLSLAAVSPMQFAAYGLIS